MLMRIGQHSPPGEFDMHVLKTVRELQKNILLLRRGRMFSFMLLFFSAILPALRHRVIVDDDTDVGIITAGPIV